MISVFIDKLWAYKVKHYQVSSKGEKKKAAASSQKQEPDERAADHCVCFESNPAFGHLALCLMCRWGQIAERTPQTISFRRCRVCKPGLDMCCQRAITSDLFPKDTDPAYPHSFYTTQSRALVSSPLARWLSDKERIYTAKIKKKQKKHYSQLQLDSI